LRSINFLPIKMLGNEKVIIERKIEILDLLSKFMEQYDDINLDFAKMKAVCEVKNFFKISEKYSHIGYLQNIILIIKIKLV